MVYRHIMSMLPLLVFIDVSMMLQITIVFLLEHKVRLVIGSEPEQELMRYWQ